MQRRSVGRGTPQGIGQRRRTPARVMATLALLTARFTALLRWRNVTRALSPVNHGQVVHAGDFDGQAK